MQASDAIAAPARLPRPSRRDRRPTRGCSATSSSWCSALAILLFAGLRPSSGASSISRRARRNATGRRADAGHQARAEPGSCRPGAQVRSVSLSGNRLAVHYDAGAAPGIAVLDLQTGPHDHQRRGRKRGPGE